MSRPTDPADLPPVMTGHFDWNEKFYPDAVLGGEPIDFAALKGSMTRFYVIPIGSKLGQRITQLLEVVHAFGIKTKVRGGRG